MDTMVDGTTMARGLLMPSLRPKLLLILTMGMDTHLDTMASHMVATVNITTLDPMVDNTAMDTMVDGTTMARGLLMPSLRPKLLLIPTMDMDTPLDTMASNMVATVNITTLDPMVDNTAMDTMVGGTTMARGLLMPSLRLKLMLIPTMDMDTPLDTMASH